MADRRPILIIDLHRSFLGAQRVLVDALDDPAAAREVVVLTAGEPRLGAELRRLGIPEVVLPMPDAMAAVTRRAAPSPRAASEAVAYVREVRRAVIRVAPGAVVANTPKAHVIAALAVPRRIPLGARLHDVLPPSWHVRMLVRGLLAPRTASVACVSDAVRRSALGLGYRPERAVSFPNGAPHVEAVAPPSGPPTIAVVGQLEPWKGQDVVIRAFGRAAPSLPGARLRVLGRPVKGPVFSRFLRELATDLGVGDRVDFEEGLTGVAEIYEGAHVLVHAPVQPDPLPTVILEAMALGIPVVATDVGGIPEMVQDGVTGLLVPPGDVHALDAAMRGMLADPQRAAAMGEAGRVRARQRFSRERYLREHTRWIGGLLGTAPPRGADDHSRGSTPDVAILGPQASR